MDRAMSEAVIGRGALLLNEYHCHRQLWQVGCTIGRPLDEGTRERSMGIISASIIADINKKKSLKCIKYSLCNSPKSLFP